MGEGLRATGVLTIDPKDARTDSKKSLYPLKLNG